MKWFACQKILNGDQVFKFVKSSEESTLLALCCRPIHYNTFYSPVICEHNRANNKGAALNNRYIRQDNIGYTLNNEGVTQKSRGKKQNNVGETQRFGHIT